MRYGAGLVSGVHKQPPGSRILDPVYEPGALMPVALGLGRGDARLHRYDLAERLMTATEAAIALCVRRRRPVIRAGIAFAVAEYGHFRKLRTVTAQLLPYPQGKVFHRRWPEFWDVIQQSMV